MLRVAISAAAALTLAASNPSPSIRCLTGSSVRAWRARCARCEWCARCARWERPGTLAPA